MGKPGGRESHTLGDKEPPAKSFFAGSRRKFMLDRAFSGKSTQVEILLGKQKKERRKKREKTELCRSGRNSLSDEDVVMKHSICSN